MELDINEGSAIKGAGYFTKAMLGNYLRGKQAKINIISLESQMGMTQLAAKQDMGYINEELGQNLWNLYDKAKSFTGEQIAAAALSGFIDVSTGDRRLLNTTFSLFKKAAEGMNRSAFLKAFETQKAADLKIAALKGEISQQKIIKKYNTGWRGVWNASLTAVGQFGEDLISAATGGAFKFGDGNQNTSPVMEADYFEQATKTLSSGAQSSTIPS